MLSTGEEIRSPQRSSRSGPILAKMPCTNNAIHDLKLGYEVQRISDYRPSIYRPVGCAYLIIRHSLYYF